MMRRRPTQLFWQTRAPCSLLTVAKAPRVAEGTGPEDADLAALQEPRHDRAAEMGVTVLFFAGAREAAGTRRASFQSPTVAKLIEQLRSEYGAGLDSLLPTCAIWVNGSPATPGTELQDGDEVAVLPPVSGGCGANGAHGRPRRKSRKVGKRR
jgi:sulfur-carrier protein